MLLQTSSPRRSTVKEEKVHVFEDARHVFEPQSFIREAKSLRSQAHAAAVDTWYVQKDIHIYIYVYSIRA